VERLRLKKRISIILEMIAIIASKNGLLHFFKVPSSKILICPLTKYIFKHVLGMHL